MRNKYFDLRILSKILGYGNIKLERKKGDKIMKGLKSKKNSEEKIMEEEKNINSEKEETKEEVAKENNAIETTDAETEKEEKIKDESKQEEVVDNTIENKKDSKEDIEKTENKEEKETDKKFEKTTKSSKKQIKEMKEMYEKKKKTKIIIAVISTIIIVVALFISTIFAFVNMNNDKIMSGISIAGIDMSGLTKEEATSKLNLIYDEKKEKEIGLKYQEYESSLNPTLMEVNYEVEKAVDEAYQIGKKDNIFINNYEILFTLIGKKNIPVNMTLNEDVTRQTIEDIGVNIPGVVIESSYSIEEDELIVTKGEAGIKLDTDSLLNTVKEKLNDVYSNDDYIEIPVIQKEPEAIDIDKIHEEVYKEAQDAYITEEPFAVYPEVEGIDFDVEAAKTMLQEDKEEYVIPLIITKPNITLTDIGEKAFPNELSTFTTRYDVSDVDRTTNLELACEKLNGKVILPGETFSYNQTLGARTASAGYKNAKIYSAGEVVDGIGGGICQISSTLYNAVLMANLEIVERRNHQFVTSYVPAGRDATVVYGSTDFKFKNTRQYPIRLVATAKNGIATVTVYGIKEETEYTFSFSTKTVASIPYTTKYEEDASLPEGTERVKPKGANGLKTETYITKMLNGKVVSTTLLSKDTYNAMTRIVLRGTKKVTNDTTNQTTETVEQQPIEQETPTEQPTTPQENVEQPEQNVTTTQ